MKFMIAYRETYNSIKCYAHVIVPESVIEFIYIYYIDYYYILSYLGIKYAFAHYKISKYIKVIILKK